MTWLVFRINNENTNCLKALFCTDKVVTKFLPKVSLISNFYIFFLVRICCIDKTLASPLVFPETIVSLLRICRKLINIPYTPFPSNSSFVTFYVQNKFAAFRLLRGQYLKPVCNCCLVLLYCYFIIAICSIYIYK